MLPFRWIYRLTSAWLPRKKYLFSVSRTFVRQSRLRSPDGLCLQSISIHWFFGGFSHPANSDRHFFRWSPSGRRARIFLYCPVCPSAENPSDRMNRDAWSPIKKRYMIGSNGFAGHVSCCFCGFMFFLFFSKKTCRFFKKRTFFTDTICVIVCALFVLHNQMDTKSKKHLLYYKKMTNGE